MEQFQNFTCDFLSRCIQNTLDAEEHYNVRLGGLMHPTRVANIKSILSIYPSKMPRLALLECLCQPRGGVQEAGDGKRVDAKGDQETQTGAGDTDSVK